LSRPLEIAPLSAGRKCTPLLGVAPVEKVDHPWLRRLLVEPSP
jgi:hypothetical protein